MSALRATRRTVYECRCERCGYKWTALSKPKSCASCKHKGWNAKPGSVRRGRPPKEKGTGK